MDFNEIGECLFSIIESMICNCPGVKAIERLEVEREVVRSRCMPNWERGLLHRTVAPHANQRSS